MENIHDVHFELTKKPKQNNEFLVDVVARWTMVHLSRPLLSGILTGIASKS